MRKVTREEIMNSPFEAEEAPDEEPDMDQDQ
jgi:hypothetical protein